MKTIFYRVGVLIVGLLLAAVAFAPLAVQAETVRPGGFERQTALNAPSIADLTAFSARVVKTQNVKVKWETGTEYTLLGFNLYRKLKKSDVWEKVNQNLLSSKTPGAIQGARYALTDKQLQSGKKYQYRLEMVGVYGNTAFSEIVTVKLP